MLGDGVEFDRMFNGQGAFSHPYQTSFSYPQLPYHPWNPQFSQVQVWFRNTMFPGEFFEKDFK